MRDRVDPWKWPVSITMAVGLMLAAALWLPRSWLGFLLSPRGPTGALEQQIESSWLVVQPPPELEVVLPEADPQPPLPPLSLPRLHQDPRWWTNGWIVGAEQDEALFATSPATPDTLQLLLTELGLDADFGSEARPDSVLAARLFLLQLHDGLRYDELKPYLTQLSRASAYADILSRAADMYDEHLRQEIRVPD